MSEEANKELVRRHYEDIVNLNNLDAAEEQMAENFVDHGARPGLASRGPEAARQAMAALHAIVPDVRVTLDEVIAEGDLVAVRATWQGTHKGPFMGFHPPASRWPSAEWSSGGLPAESCWNDGHPWTSLPCGRINRPGQWKSREQ